MNFLVSTYRTQVTVIDYSVYMKDGNDSTTVAEQPVVDEENAIHKLTDQKNYLEERNR